MKLNAKLNKNKNPAVPPPVVHLGSDDDKVPEPDNVDKSVNSILQYENLPYEPFNIETTEITAQKHKDIAQAITDYYGEKSRNVNDQF